MNEEVTSRDMTQEEIKEQFGKADKLFKGKEFEDGAVVTKKCLHCGGENGHHYMNCSGKDEEVGGGLQSAAHPGPDEVDTEAAKLYETDDEGIDHELVRADGTDEVESPPLSEESLEQVEVDVKAAGQGGAPWRRPPTEKDLLSNDMIWLIAKCCHEVNRAYCVSIGDHSHDPWGITSAELRASAHSGVEYHRDNPGVSPEDSHAEWMKYKLAEGWRFGNAKDEVAKTHPNLIPFHQLHAQERAKDGMFTAICDTFFGGNKS